MTILRIQFIQQRLTLSDPAMEDAFFNTTLYLEFAQLEQFSRLPDESTILGSRHWREKHRLAGHILATVNQLWTERGLPPKPSTAVDATVIATTTPTKNKDKIRDPEIYSRKNGDQWYAGMKAHIGVDAESGLVHTVRCTSGNISNIAEANSLLHGQEKDVICHVAMRPGKRRALNVENEADTMTHKAEKLKVAVRAKVEDPFGLIKRQFGHLKVCYRGLKKNSAELVTLFALSDLRMVHDELMGARA